MPKKKAGKAEKPPPKTPPPAGKKPAPGPAAAQRKRADAAELAKRVDDVLRARIDGAQYHDVLQISAEKGWDVKERQLRDYMRRADALLVEQQDRSRKNVVARHLAQRQALYARAVNAADYRTALAILDSDAKLRGLYPEKEVKELAKLAAEQGARIRELETRLDAAQPTPDATPGE